MRQGLFLGLVLGVLLGVSSSLQASSDCELFIRQLNLEPGDGSLIRHSFVVSTDHLRRASLLLSQGALNSGWDFRSSSIGSSWQDEKDQPEIFAKLYLWIYQTTDNPFVKLSALDNLRILFHSYSFFSLERGLKKLQDAGWPANKIVPKPEADRMSFYDWYQVSLENFQDVDSFKNLELIHAEAAVQELIDHRVTHLNPMEANAISGLEFLGDADSVRLIFELYKQMTDPLSRHFLKTSILELRDRVHSRPGRHVEGLEFTKDPSPFLQLMSSVDDSVRSVAIFSGKLSSLLKFAHGSDLQEMIYSAVGSGRFNLALEIAGFAASNVIHSRDRTILLSLVRGRLSLDASDSRMIHLLGKVGDMSDIVFLQNSDSPEAQSAMREINRRLETPQDEEE